MGTHYVAVNPGAVMVSYNEQNKVWKATMNATKDQLKSAPEFKYGGQWTASRKLGVKTRAERSLRCGSARHLEITEEERSWLIKQRISITSGS